MKAIIIEDKDAKALLAKLELEQFKQGRSIKNADSEALAQMHRWFQYVVVGWLQEQGADLHGT